MMSSIDFITLGCSKNLVDSERLIAKLEACGYIVKHDPDKPSAEIAVINTCGFIGDAKEESINTILQYAQAKSEGSLKKLYVMGCLSERYLKELTNEIPEVDAWFGKFNYTELISVLGHKDNDDDYRHRKITTPGHYAYVKISEGCNRRCSYCAIPIITGKHKSRPMDEIVAEVRLLVSQGVKEFQIIAQELTYYGLDLYNKRCIAELVERIANVPGVEWVRLHYAYPTDFPMDLIDVMAKKKNVCNYLDIALQHISDNMLSAMHRNVTKEQTIQLISNIRNRLPGIHLRTTLMVGFPNETDDDFNQLLDFVKEMRFERVGAFMYSEEEGTFSANHYTDNVPTDIKQQRLDRLMQVQQQISAEIQAQKIGMTLRVVIDRQEGDYWVGRTEYDSPEVDPEVLIKKSHTKIKVGEFYEAKIIDCDEFDLYAEYDAPHVNC